jgi:hypothetical protein
LPSAVCAQSVDNSEVGGKAPAAEAAAPETPTPPPDKRVFGVLPNYRTADGSLPFAPITTKHKFYIAEKDSFDYPVVVLSGIFASFYQLQNSNPSFGQGMAGYGKRLASSYADQAIGNLMTEAVFPSLLRQDPRYFRLGETGGTGWYRTKYAVSRVFVGRSDKGKWGFNYSEWLGNGTTVALSNLYYPSDTRNVEDNVEKLLIQVGTDAFSQVLKEFWPDWKRKLLKKKH